jgi:hypothetical protein
MVNGAPKFDWIENKLLDSTGNLFEVLDDNTVLFCCPADSEADHSFMMTYQYRDLKIQTFDQSFSQSFNALILGYGNAELDLLNRPQNSNPLVQEIFDELTIRFEEDWMPFFMNVYKYSLLELIPYCTDEELKRIKIALK